MRLDRTPGGEAGAVFVCANGAGGHKDDRGMQCLGAALLGLEVVRFDFPYRALGSRRPDPMPVLKESVAAIAGRIRAPGRRLFLGGRSMGGRAASMLAADGYACDGLLLFAYPLHPAGKPGQLRTAHWPEIGVPVLCVNGTRDALCTRELMERELARLDNWTMHWLDGADHSFRTLKSSGRTEDQVYEEIGEAAARWLAAR
jgi:predicted alpha/beta-hydrolase family hydrolase